MTLAAMVAAATLALCEPAAPPSNLRVTAELGPVVADMVRHSPTFRDQCLRLSRLRVVDVTVAVDGPDWVDLGGTSRAYTVLRRFQYGRVVADIHLRSLDGAAALLAHELEHVLEFAEGLQYLAASSRPGSGVWRSDGGHFETVRAIQAGRTVAGEMERSSTQ